MTEVVHEYLEKYSARIFLYSRHRSDSDTFKLKDLNPGKYNLILLRKINTKFGYCVIAKLFVDVEGKEHFLPNKQGKLSGATTRRNYKFNYARMNDGNINVN